MNYGFVIDNRSCISCHACSTACKSENSVPLGVNRTWVKNVEIGQYPDVQRHFQVTRCNHCANPPCVRICPTQAMYQRADGIVEFNNSQCIGCKACLQACPYDAIYIDPDTGTAAKCHYCAHRIDLNLEPACVVICPTHSIIAGDMDDPTSEISRVLARNEVTVRKPEQGTAPKLFYISGNAALMHPTATERAPATFQVADVISLHGNGKHSHNGSPSAKTGQTIAGTPVRLPVDQGQPAGGPIQFGARVAEQMVQVSYNAQHKIPWHWQVPAYLVTKGIGTGLFMLLSLGWILGLLAFDPLTYVVGGLLSLIFIGLTTALLVLDLEKPQRFFYMVVRPQWRSWLTRGAYLLMSFSTVTGLWWLLEAGALFGLLDGALAAMVRPVAMWLGLVLAAGVAVYTAFLFGQAEGRDLWQSSLLPAHLIVQASMAGSGLLLLVNVLSPLPSDFLRIVPLVFGVSVVLDALVTLLGEFGMPHASEVAARAAHDIVRGRYKNVFWWGSVALGHVVPAALMLVGNLLAGALAAVCAIAGLYLFEYAFVMAPQDVPNS